MVRLLAFALAAYCFLQPELALAQDAAKQLAGSWKLTSWTIQITGGDITEPFGRSPKGRALITSDGYAAFVIAATNRKPAANDTSRQPSSRRSWFTRVHSQSKTTSSRPRSTYHGMSFSPGRTK